jgi:hypothetical protein
MTVAVGFACHDGLVLSADSEMSTDSDKFNDDKAWYLRFPANATQPNLKVGIVGSGNTDFLRYTKELIERDLRPDMDLVAAQGVIQGVLNKVHNKHIYPYGQPHERAVLDVEFVIGILARDGRRLLSTLLTTVTEVKTHHSTGAGRLLTNFLVKRSGFQQFDVNSAIALSVQILVYGERHVFGVGGPKRILVMRSLSQDAGWLREESIKKHEAFIEKFDAAIQPIMFGGPDKTVSDKDFAARLDKLRRDLLEVRSIKQNITIPIGAGSLSFFSDTPLPLRKAISSKEEG